MVQKEQKETPVMVEVWAKRVTLGILENLARWVPLELRVRMARWEIMGPAVLRVHRDPQENRA